MPETRYIEVYEEGTSKVIGRQPYTVSDEQLQKERDDQTLRAILGTSPEAITMPKIWEALRILIKRNLLP